MIWNDSSLFIFIIICLSHMIEPQVIEDGYANGVKQKYASSLGKEWDLDRVEPKA